MRKVRLDPRQDIPIVKVVLRNACQKMKRGRLVFDTGSDLTQVDVDLIEHLGYSARNALGTRRVRGATGDAVEGYTVQIASLEFLGQVIPNVRVLTYDFKNFPNLDGLLGWDVIRQLHIELNGPQEMLKIF